MTSSSCRDPRATSVPPAESSLARALLAEFVSPCAKPLRKGCSSRALRVLRITGPRRPARRRSRAVACPPDGPSPSAAACGALGPADVRRSRTRGPRGNGRPAGQRHLPDSKTEGGRRRLQVPEVLRTHLLALAKGKRPEDLLFGRHWRDWPREWVHRICKAAKVPVVTAHGMRGLHGTLAVETGLSAHAVAAALGHESVTTTLQSYAEAGAGAAARQQRVLTVLEGAVTIRITRHRRYCRAITPGRTRSGSRCHER